MTSTPKSRDEDLYRQMIAEVVDYAIIRIGPNGDIQTWNLGAERIKGYQAEDVIGLNFRRFYTEADRAEGKPDRLLAEARREGRAQDEGWRVRKDGTRFWASVTITAVHDEFSEVVGFSKVTRDLTERVAAETQLRNMAQKLQSKNTELEQFAYITSHDLQEPLRTVASYSGLLKRRYGDRLDDDATEWLGFISEAVGRMSSMIDGLLQHSRIGRDPSPADVDMQRTAEAARSDLQAAIDARQATVRICELPTVRGMETELRLLLQNLVGNALKFVDPDVDPVVSLSAEKIAGAWRFWVEDNGIGIDPSQRERIFRIFQRLNTREEFEGTGMGLAHCRKIIDAHKGTIGVEPTPQGGSRFFFTLPE